MNMKISNGLKNFNGLIKSSAGIVILSIFSVPFIALAEWTTGTPPGGLPDDELGAVLANIINGVLGLIAAVSVLYIIYGGARYLISSGDDNKVEAAKSTLKDAVLGLFFALLAYAIIVKVINIING